jgi:eukaryotic-like serine/threonine-protein kinase
VSLGRFSILHDFMTVLFNSPRARGWGFSAPDLIISYENLAVFTFALQRFDEARRIIRDAQARKMDDDDFHNVLYALAFFGADSAAMAEQQQWYAGKPEYEGEGLALASATEAYGGRLLKARELTKGAVDSAERMDNKEAAASDLADAAVEEAAFGNAAQARTRRRL